MENNLLKCKNLKELYSLITTSNYNFMSYIILFYLIVIPVFEVPLYYINNQLWYDTYPLLITIAGTLAIVYMIFYITGFIVMRDVNILLRFRKRPYLLLFALFIIWCFLSAFNSSNHVYSFIGSFTRHEGFLTYIYYGSIFLCSIQLKDTILKDRLLKVFVGVSLLLCLMMLFQYICPLESKVVTTNRSAVFFHFNHFGYYLNLSLIVLFGLYINEKNTSYRIAITALIFFEIFTLVINNTFGCFLAAGLSLVIYAVLYYKKKANLRKVGELALIFILSNLIICTLMYKADFSMNIPKSFSGFFKDIGLISESFTEADVNLDSIGTGRGILWERTMTLIKNRPLLGYGPDMLEARYISFGDFIHSRPANEYLYFAAAMGIPALLFYMSALFNILAIQWKRIKQLSDITLLSAACVCGYLISAFFGNSTFYITPYFLMFLGFSTQFQDK